MGKFTEMFFSEEQLRTYRSDKGFWVGRDGIEYCIFCGAKRGEPHSEPACLDAVSAHLLDRSIMDRTDAASTKQVGGEHYKKLAIQPIEYCHRNGLGPCESFVVKYVTRYKDKNGKEDLLKAIHCLELLISMEYPDES